MASAQSQTPPGNPTTTAARTAGAAVKPGLPAAIAAAFKRAYPDAVIKNWSKETENGKTEYEVESMDGTIARDVTYAPDGTAVLIEESMPIAELPAPVSAAVARLYSKAAITKAERVTAPTKAMQYEVALKGAKVAEVVFTADGQVIK